MSKNNDSDSEMKTIPLNDEETNGQEKRTNNNNGNEGFEESVRVISGEIEGCCIIL